MYNVILTENTKNAVQRDALKNIIDKPKWNLKKMFKPTTGRQDKEDKD